MKKLLCFIVISLQLIKNDAKPVLAIPNKYSVEDAEDGYHQYIKWANMASSAAKSKYPSAAIVDFHYVGCAATLPTTRHLVYKFWLREANGAFGVYVTIAANKGTGRAVVLKVEKADGSIPYYGKWRRIVQEAVKQKYPDAIINGSPTPQGCHWIRNNAASQTFSQWVNRNNQSQIVEVTIQYIIDSEKVMTIEVKERRRFKSTIGATSVPAMQESQRYLCQDMLMLFLLPYIQEAVNQHYVKLLHELPLVYPYQVDVINAGRVDGGPRDRGFHFYITLAVTPVVGPHISVGKDKITFEISPKFPNSVKLASFQHLETHTLPQHWQDIVRGTK
ncbi:DUF3889 domain-containing protein [Cohnella candidum]|nr:DUF3888 domain-containing protein [Cohnella candidum]